MSQHGQEEQDSTLLTTSAQTCTVHSNVSFAGDDNTHHTTDLLIQVRDQMDIRRGLLY